MEAQSWTGSLLSLPLIHSLFLQLKEKNLSYVRESINQALSTSSKQEDFFTSRTHQALKDFLNILSGIKASFKEEDITQLHDQLWQEKWTFGQDKPSIPISCITETSRLCRAPRGRAG